MPDGKHSAASVHRFKAMGSPCELRVYGDRADLAADAARAEVLRLEAKYSRYREDSLASRINASAGDAAGVEVDEETARLLDYAATAWRESGGRFDITSGVLRRAWDFKSGRLPEQRALDAKRSSGWNTIRMITASMW